MAEAAAFAEREIVVYGDYAVEYEEYVEDEEYEGHEENEEKDVVDKVHSLD